MIRPSLVVGAAMLAAPVLAQSPRIPDAVRGRIAARCQQVLEDLHDRADFPGGSAALILPDGSEVTLTVGVSSLEDGSPMSPTDRMLSGSIGKTYVAAAILRLVHAKKLSLDDKAATWLGEHEWFARLPNAESMTLRHLLRHESGLPRYVLHRAFWKTLLQEPDKVWKPEELLAYVLDEEPLFAAGEGWAYSDTNYIVAGMILERATGEKMYDHVREHFLVPHRLRDTLPSDRRRLAGLIPGYTTLFLPLGMKEKVLDRGVFVINPQFEWCGGGFLNTPLDLARWARIAFSGQAFEGHADCLEIALDGVPAPQLGEGTRYGIGVMIHRTEAGTLLGHDGVFPGYNSTMGYFPEHGIAAAFQMNRDGQQAVQQPMTKLLVDCALLAVDELQKDR